MDVPLFDIREIHESLREELFEAWERVFRSQAFILGEEVEKLEEQIASYCGCEFAIGVSSGTDALLVSLMAAAIGPGDEVITTPFSFFATAGVIVRLGARPVFVDIDPRTYNIDLGTINSAITPRTKAIVPVHLFGQCVDVESIKELAQERDLWVVEDAAQAIGAQFADGRRAGTAGDVGCFSFYPTKNLGAMGDAGMLVTGSPTTAQKLRLLRVHGAHQKYDHAVVGGNFRLDAIQAAVLRVKLGHLDRWTKERQSNARRYRELFSETDLADHLRLPEAVLEPTGVDHFHIYNQFVIAVSDRDRLREHLEARGVGTAIYYPVPSHLQTCFEFLGYSEGDFPQAERAAKETLALPIYPGLSERQQRHVVSSIREFYDR